MGHQNDKYFYLCFLLYVSLTVALAWIYSEEFVKSCPDAFIVKNTRVPVSSLQLARAAAMIQSCYFFICTGLIFISVKSSRPPKVNDLKAIIFFVGKHSVVFTIVIICVAMVIYAALFSVSLLGIVTIISVAAVVQLVRYFPQVSDIVAWFISTSGLMTVAMLPVFSCVPLLLLNHPLSPYKETTTLPFGILTLILCLVCLVLSWCMCMLCTYRDDTSLKATSSVQ